VLAWIVPPPPAAPPPAISALCISEVAAIEDELSAHLDAEERAVYAGLRLPKRRLDWLAGRVAAKMAARARFGGALVEHGVRVRGEGPDSGRPWLARGWLSISHAGDLAAAVVDERPIGLDLEVVAERPELEQLAFDPATAEALRALPAPARALGGTAAWAAMEAVAKWRGDGLRAPFGALGPPAGATIERGRFEHRGVPMVWALVKTTDEERPPPGEARNMGANE
jgi:phosphopantetheinyl transferase